MIRNAVLGLLAVASTAAASTCPLGYELGPDNGCYKLMCGNVNYTQATQVCKMHNADLATITDIPTNKFVRGLTNTSTPIWFKYDSAFSFSKFGDDDDDDSTYSNMCSHMGTCGPDDSAWYYSNCSIQMNYVCKLNVGATEQWSTDLPCFEIYDYPKAACYAELFWLLSGILVVSLMCCGCCCWAFVLGMCIMRRSNNQRFEFSCNRSGWRQPNYVELSTTAAPEKPRLAFYEDDLEGMPPLYECPPIEIDDDELEEVN